MRPSLRDADFEVERKVILEEIGMYEDQPSFIAYENAMKTHFDGHPLGQSILGSSDSISALKRDQMADYHREHYRGGNITIAVAGNTDWNDVLRLANQWCGEWEAGSTPRTTDEARPKAGKTLDDQGSVHAAARDADVTRSLGHKPSADGRRADVGRCGRRLGQPALLGPGRHGTRRVGRPLVQRVRRHGTYLTYVCSTPESAGDNLKRIADIYADVNAKGVTEEELEQARNKAASRIVLRSERPMGRLSSLGSNWVYRNEYRSVQDDLTPSATSPPTTSKRSSKSTRWANSPHQPSARWTRFNHSSGSRTSKGCATGGSFGPPVRVSLDARD